MISRAFRFHGYGSLRYVYQNGRTVRGPFMATKFAQNERRKTYRLAVVVSKKVSKSAVTRNRIRRRIYEQVRLRQDEITTPYDIVITVFSEQLAALAPVELAKAVSGQLQQAGIINPPSAKKPETA